MHMSSLMFSAPEHMAQVVVPGDVRVSDRSFLAAHWQFMWY
jgi:hypothetical protein